MNRLAFLLATLVWLAPAHAQSTAALPVPAAPIIGAASHILIDHHSGQTLTESNADRRVEPASLTKLMTGYVLFHEMRAGKVTLGDEVLISERAWRTEGSRTFVEPGRRVAMLDLIRGMIVQSGNDATVAIAEHVAGSEASFADLMNRHAARLGMRETRFMNSTGLPHPEHYTTARDLALLARAIIREFPEEYRWYSERNFTYNRITQYNRNKLLWRDSAVDGIKTGHTESAGYCLVTSGQRDGMRLITVVLGSKNEESRAQESLALLNWGFRFYETRRLYTGGTRLTDTRIWKGSESQLALGVTDDVYVTLPRGQYKQMNASLEIDRMIVAPVAQGDAYGQVKVHIGDRLLVERPLVALSPVARGGLLRRLFDQIALLFQ